MTQFETLALMGRLINYHKMGIKRDLKHKPPTRNTHTPNLKGNIMDNTIKSIYSGLCKLLEGLGCVDDGVESVLTTQAFDGLMEIVQSVYGETVAAKIETLFTQREDGSLVFAAENGSERLREILFEWIDSQLIKYKTGD